MNDAGSGMGYCRLKHGDDYIVAYTLIDKQFSCCLINERKVMKCFVRLFYAKISFLFFCLLLLTDNTYASTPAEMADLSLQDLFSLSTDEAVDTPESKRWSFNFRGTLKSFYKR